MLSMHIDKISTTLPKFQPSKVLISRLCFAIHFVLKTFNDTKHNHDFTQTKTFAFYEILSLFFYTCFLFFMR